MNYVVRKAMRKFMNKRNLVIAVTKCYQIAETEIHATTCKVYLSRRIPKHNKDTP
jgi:hypothetical protein